MPGTGPLDAEAKALARARLKEKLARLPAKQRLDAIIDDPRSRQLLRALPHEELYRAIAEVGLADATEIVQLASPAQFRALVDLGGWARDTLDPHRVLTWLRAARGDDLEEFWKKVRGLDFELILLLLRKTIVVYDLEEDPDANPQGLVVESPENRYLIEITPEGVDASALRDLVNDFIAENPFESSRMFEALRWELESELEETSFRFRTGRLRDLGFPDPDEAFSLFAQVPLEPRAAPGALAGEALARGGERQDLLAAAFAGLTGDEQEALEAELRYVVNAALVAEAADPGDLDAVRRGTELARDYLQVGLEVLSGGEPGRASDVVQEHPLKHVFRVGFSATLRLKFRVDRLARRPEARVGDVWLVLPEVLPTLAALRRKRPLRALRVDGAEPVPFRSLRELWDAEGVVVAAELQVGVLSHLLGGTPESAGEAFARFRSSSSPEPGAAGLLAALIGHAALDGVVRPSPLPAARLTELGERLFEVAGGQATLRGSTRERVLATLGAGLAGELSEELARIVDRTLARLLEELGPPFAAEGRLDPQLASQLPTVP